MSDEASTPLKNRRRVERIRTLLETSIAYGEAAAIASCRIIDLSPAGAMIELDPNLVLVRPLRLLLSLDGVACEARVAWRTGERAGLAFERRYDLRGEVPRGIEGLQAIWRAGRGG